jgi:tetratricopeptide (TPR) repeat protein
VSSRVAASVWASSLLLALGLMCFAVTKGGAESLRWSDPEVRNFSAISQQSAPQGAGQQPGSTPQELFLRGENALRDGNLDEAERCFKQVVAMDDGVAGAYANLGVIYMRRKQWNQALTMLHKAERLAPKVSGIRLNIGLVYYRQNIFNSAIAPFESVVRDQPDSLQGRYLLGLCYFFNERWADATKVLAPLWTQESNQLNYLYVLGIAAGKAGQHELEDRALGRLVEVGQGSPEFHLFMGKAYLNRQEYDKAATELEAAAQGDPKLPFVHFNLGLAYKHKRDLDRAKAEFLKDAAIESDVAFDYDELGSIYAAQQQEEEAEQNFRRALRLDPQLLTSRLGLAKIYQHQDKYKEALAELDAARKIDPDSYNVHFLRGQNLLRLGRKQEGQAELDSATRILNTDRAKRQQELDTESVPSPELRQEPQ